MKRTKPDPDHRYYFVPVLEFILPITTKQDGGNTAISVESSELLDFALCLITCRDEEDPGAEDDVVAGLVELAGSYTQASHEEQDHAEDGEDAGCSHSTYGARQRETINHADHAETGRRIQDREKEMSCSMISSSALFSSQHKAISVLSACK